MKIPVIKRLVETTALDALRQAEEDLLEENPLQIEVGGDDEGEQLTHIFAAIYILEQIQNEGMEFKQALRAYTLKVRTSIS
ncbi:MAG: hypothetical protein HEP71_26220 [Roseivirga sp.]|nr:hypothetical protein [Roseivirga sp.]